MRSTPDSVIGQPGCADCPHRLGSGSGCGVVEAGHGAPLDGFLGRESCYLKDRLRDFARRLLAHRPGVVTDADDLVQEVAAHLLAGVARRAGGAAQGLRPFLGYLRRTLWTRAVDLERREQGRVRCGNCESYAAYTHVCLAGDHAWTHAPLPPGQDPRALDPACTRFRSRRRARALDLQANVPDAVAVPDEVWAVREALVELAASNPRAALVVRARLLDQRSYDDLLGHGVSLRTLKRDFAEGIEFLREKLGPGRHFDRAEGRSEEKGGD